MTVASPSAAAPAGRLLGPYEIKALLGKSATSMLWQAVDTREQANKAERLLLLPRHAPADLEAWMQRARQAQRVQHPALAPAVDIGLADQRPYLAYERALGLTVDERLARLRVPAPPLAVEWMVQLAEALATVHDAVCLMHELQPYQLLLAEDGKAFLLGFGLFDEGPATDAPGRAAQQSGQAQEALALGLLLNRLLGGQAPLEMPDTAEVLKRIAPNGSDFVRLGYDPVHPVDEALRAICNRATATLPAQRYLQARPLARALDGWLQRVNQPDAGAVGQLLERLQRYGALPVTRPEAVRAVQAGGLEQVHTGQMAALVQQDIALSLELLRRVNLARSGAGDRVLALQRALKMLGLEQVAAAAVSLKPWPGVLAPERVLNLRLAIARAHRAADVAVALRPAGYDPDMQRLAALLQNLGRLLMYYHLPDEADQVQELMKPPPPTEAHPEPHGLSERQAAFSVLGCDIDSLATAVLRQWGLGEEAQQLAQRPLSDQAIHPPHGDIEHLRLTAALANELVDALQLPNPRRRKLLLEVTVRRYARALGLTGEEVQLALFPESAQASVQSS